MEDRPVMRLQSRAAAQPSLDRLLDIFVTLTMTQATDGLDQAEAVVRQFCRLTTIRALATDEDAEHETEERPWLPVVADNGVRFVAWPPERLTEPDVQAALHLLARFVPRLLRAPAPSPDEDEANASGILGRSDATRRLHDRIERVAARAFSVLIEGESGVGKELVARRVHALSARRRGPFVAVNCAAIVESLLEAELFGIEERTATGVRGRRGKFEQADGGTLFLDEVADLSMAAQAKLLRTIQDLAVERVGAKAARHLDVRIVAATNRTLSSACAAGTFRRDLYYRLNAVEITVPPLRARREDIPLLADRFLRRYGEGRQYRLSGRALDALVVHEWPGNVRELERVIERAVTLASSELIDVGDLPDSVIGRYHEVLVPPALDEDQSLRAWAGRYARLVLGKVGGNKREACRVLGISYHTLQAYLTDRRVRAEEQDQPGAAAPSDPPSATYRIAPARRSTLLHEGPASRERAHPTSRPATP